ncbi:MAG: phage tail protein, partial [Erysipelotrichaceae bacterium]
MLKIKTSNDWLPITNQSNYFIEYDEEGEQTLSFDLSIKDGLAKYIVNEAIIQSDNNEYLIKGINRPSYVMSVTCQLNLDDWMDGHYLKTKDIVELQTKTIDDVLEFVKPNGWTVLGKTIRTIKRTIDLEKCNRYDIMMRCKDVYNVQYDFDTIKKIVTIVDPDLKIDNGVYVTPELNMKSMAYMGTSSNLINRLYCYGADDLTFASINGGKPYVEITDFKGTPICASWTDERYTNAQDLLDDAKVKLSKMSYPSGAYTIDVIDLASLKEEYKFLEFKLRHLVHAIIDPEHKIDVIHRVVRFRDYPDEKSRNKVTLSNTPRKVNDLLSSYKESIESIEADGIHYETSIRNSSKEIELISKGLNETKLKLTSDQIMMIVSQAIKEGNSLNTVQVVIDSLGLTVKNGGIKVYDINNNLVLFV